ncbi:MAG: ChbG/HpnK family deacetylase [Chloroflexi bacterium]|jgi:predicted glycoside hydrolase/deacetylase ChbG (UPF0249 family)|nr:ChbG/HpnK family deacetylase [Chloroflexota bacterium]
MNANPVMKKLGLADDDRAVIFHADDIGSFQSTLDAYAELLDFGLLSSAAAMVPCPWFPAAAELCRNRQDLGVIDMGVHLTVTSEWESYRWGPVSTRDRQSGLIDEDGYFHPTAHEIHQGADLTALEAELRAQIEQAQTSGIDITHIDSHMLTLFHHRLLDVYFKLGLEYQVPAFCLRQDVNGIWQHYLDEKTVSALVGQIKRVEDFGMPLLDHVHVMPLDRPENREQQLKAVLASIPPGITYLIIHPAKDTPELRAAASPEDWPNRVADYQLFLSETMRDYVTRSGIHVLGYRALRDLMRS